jgi:hypothetical protein
MFVCILILFALGDFNDVRASSTTSPNGHLAGDFDIRSSVPVSVVLPSVS